MSGKRIWPASDAEFNIWYKNIVQITAGKTSGANPLWKHIPREEAEGFIGRYEDWSRAYSAYLVPHIPSVTTAKNEARRAAEKDIRRFKRLYLDSDFVSDAERVDMRLPIRHRVGSTVPAPLVPAEGDVFFPGTGLVKLANIRPVMDVCAIYDKRSLYGVKIAYGIMRNTGKTSDKFPLKEVPVTGDDLPHSKFIRGTSYTFNFQGESVNTAYFCLCYENGKAEEGPWGPIVKAVIP